MQAEDTAVVELTEFDRRLAEAKTLTEVAQLAREALSLRDVAKAALRSRPLANRALVAYARAARKGGEMLADVPRSEGGRPRRNSERGATSFEAALKAAAIARSTAERWQELAKVAVDRFLEWCIAAENDEVEPVIGSLLASTAHLSSSKDEWATPQALYDALDAEFHFTLDVCASSQNAKAPRYFSKDINGLSQSWDGEIAFMNPPYSAIEEWMEKAYAEAGEGATVVCVVPSRTDVGWFWDFASDAEVRFLRGRVHFVDDEGNTGPAPFPSAIVVLGPKAKPSMFCWEWAARD